MVGIINAILEVGIQMIVVLKAAQVGYTTGLQNFIGWCVCQDPSPMLIVLPDETACDKLVAEQIKPLIENSPALQERLSDAAWAIKKNTIQFDSMPIYLGYSGSPQSLASRAVRYVLFDEVNKFQSFSGRDAAPIPLGIKRSSTYGHRARILIGSTPTTPDGEVSKAFAECGDKRYFNVPCPHCSHYQQLAFTQLRFDSPEIKAIDDKAKRADYIEFNNAAYFECNACHGEIYEKHKPQMMLKGVWLSETQTISRDGKVHGERPQAKRVGFQLSAMYSPWVSFSQMAAQFVRSVGDYGAMMEFRNQWLGEAFENVDTNFKVDDLTTQVADAPAEGIVPAWAGILTSTVDVHEHRLNFVIRAHGRDKSQLIAFGDVTTFEEITQLCLNRSFQIEGTTDLMSPSLLMVDSGYRTDEVYAYAQSDPRIRAVKGATEFKPAKVLTWSTPSKALGIQLGIIDTQFYKSKLARLRGETPQLWFINNKVNREYLMHLAGEHRVTNKSGQSVWQKTSAGAQNHFLDCECYQLAAAEFLHTTSLPDETTLIAQRNANKQQREQLARPQPPRNQWLPNANNWLRAV
jgi:phage terminase large subunit GpA-like protein